MEPSHSIGTPKNVSAARDVNSAIASIMRAGAMELWNMRNQVQQQLEIERGISALVPGLLRSTDLNL